MGGRLLPVHLDEQTTGNSASTSALEPFCYYRTDTIGGVMTAHEHWQMDASAPSFTSATSFQLSLRYGPMICSTMSGQGVEKAYSTSPAGQASSRGSLSSEGTSAG